MSAGKVSIVLHSCSLQSAGCSLVLLLCLVNNQMMPRDFIDSYCCYSSVVVLPRCSAYKSEEQGREYAPAHKCQHTQRKKRTLAHSQACTCIIHINITYRLYRLSSWGGLYLFKSASADALNFSLLFPTTCTLIHTQANSVWGPSDGLHE